MQFIVESGSTKSTWVLVDDGGQEVQRLDTTGINPFFQSQENIAEIASEVASKSDFSPRALFFYGAGCSSEQRCLQVKNALGKHFGQTRIEVQHDLMAAARSAAGREEGIVAILGTGSNSCAYNGNEIIDNVPALGYALGDEGSGSDLGRRLVQAWMYREMDDELRTSFEAFSGLNKESMLDAVYHQPRPNKFLASLAPFCDQHMDHSVISTLVGDALESFVHRHLLKYVQCQTWPVHFVGSIAHAFENKLRAICEEQGLNVDRIVHRPVDALVKFHVHHDI